MDATECSECHRILFWGDDDTGDDDERPLCEECQGEEEELQKHRENEIFSMESFSRMAGIIKGVSI